MFGEGPARVESSSENKPLNDSTAVEAQNGEKATLATASFRSERETTSSSSRGFSPPDIRQYLGNGSLERPAYLKKHTTVSSPLVRSSSSATDQDIAISKGTIASVKTALGDNLSTLTGRGISDKMPRYVTTDASTSSTTTKSYTSGGGGGGKTVVTTTTSTSGGGQLDDIGRQLLEESQTGKFLRHDTTEQQYSRPGIIVTESVTVSEQERASNAGDVLLSNPPQLESGAHSGGAQASSLTVTRSAAGDMQAGDTNSFTKQAHDMLKAYKKQASVETLDSEPSQDDATRRERRHSAISGYSMDSMAAAYGKSSMRGMETLLYVAGSPHAGNENWIVEESEVKRMQEQGRLPLGGIQKMDVRTAGDQASVSTASSYSLKGQAKGRQRSASSSSSENTVVDTTAVTTYGHRANTNDAVVSGASESSSSGLVQREESSRSNRSGSTKRYAERENLPARNPSTLSNTSYASSYKDAVYSFGAMSPASPTAARNMPSPPKVRAVNAVSSPKGARPASGITERTVQSYTRSGTSQGGHSESQSERGFDLPGSGMVVTERTTKDYYSGSGPTSYGAASGNTGGMEVTETVVKTSRNASQSPVRRSSSRSPAKATGSVLKRTESKRSDDGYGLVELRNEKKVRNIRSLFEKQGFGALNPLGQSEGQFHGHQDRDENANVSQKVVTETITHASGVTRDTKADDTRRSHSADSPRSSQASRPTSSGEVHAVRAYQVHSTETQRDLSTESQLATESATGDFHIPSTQFARGTVVKQEGKVISSPKGGRRGSSSSEEHNTYTVEETYVTRTSGQDTSHQEEAFTTATGVSSPPLRYKTGGGNRESLERYSRDYDVSPTRQTVVAEEVMQSTNMPARESYSPQMSPDGVLPVEVDADDATRSLRSAYKKQRQTVIGSEAEGGLFSLPSDQRDLSSNTRVHEERTIERSSGNAFESSGGYDDPLLQSRPSQRSTTSGGGYSEHREERTIQGLSGNAFETSGGYDDSFLQSHSSKRSTKVSPRGGYSEHSEEAYVSPILGQAYEIDDGITETRGLEKSESIRREEAEVNIANGDVPFDYPYSPVSSSSSDGRKRKHNVWHSEIGISGIKDTRPSSTSERREIRTTEMTRDRGAVLDRVPRASREERVYKSSAKRSASSSRLPRTQYNGQYADHNGQQGGFVHSYTSVQRRGSDTDGHRSRGHSGRSGQVGSYVTTTGSSRRVARHGSDGHRFRTNDKYYGRAQGFDAVESDRGMWHGTVDIGKIPGSGGYDDRQVFSDSEDYVYETVDGYNSSRRNGSNVIYSDVTGNRHRSLSPGHQLYVDTNASVGKKTIYSEVVSPRREVSQLNTSFHSVADSVGSKKNVIYAEVDRPSHHEQVTEIHLLKNPEEEVIVDEATIVHTSQLVEPQETVIHLTQPAWEREANVNKIKLGKDIEERTEVRQVVEQVQEPTRFSTETVEERVFVPQQDMARSRRVDTTTRKSFGPADQTDLRQENVFTKAYSLNKANPAYHSDDEDETVTRTYTKTSSAAPRDRGRSERYERKEYSSHLGAAGGGGASAAAASSNRSGGGGGGVGAASSSSMSREVKTSVRPDISVRGVSQNIDVNHYEEEVTDLKLLHHADGSPLTDPKITLSFDNIQEDVGIEVASHVAQVLVTITAERWIPIDMRAGKWKKSAVEVKRTIGVDLGYNNERREFYQNIVQPGKSISFPMKDLESDRVHRRPDGDQLDLDQRQTLRLYKQLMGIAETDQMDDARSDIWAPTTDADQEPLQLTAGGMLNGKY